METTRRLWLVLISAALLLACQASDRQVGSECPENGCSEAAAIQRGLTCQISSSQYTIGSADGVPAELCLARPLPVDAQGLVACRLRWDPDLPPTGGAEPSCDPPFSEAADDVDGRCMVRQLTPAERTAGTERGWFYSLTDDCPKVQLSAGESVPGGSLHLECATARAPDQAGVMREVDPDLCAPPTATRDSSFVGSACTPQIVPENGFDPREASIEAPAAECATGVCLVYALAGDPSPDCAPPAECPSAEALQHSVYCSCRCDAPGGSSPECDCPEGFSCLEVLSSGPDTVRGGYCVRND